MTILLDGVFEVIDISAWMTCFLHRVNETFPDRVWFVGIQGSYGREEATEDSDIDMVVILDELTARDVDVYRAMLDTLPNRELLCGFLSGKQEILNWEPSDLFQFCQDMTPVKGSLEEVLAMIGPEAVDRAIKIGSCNLYHGCVHNMLHRRCEDTLRGFYKAAAFTVQAIYFRQTGNYVRHQRDLLNLVSGQDQLILETSIGLKNGDAVKFEEMSQLLFDWTGKWICNS